MSLSVINEIERSPLTSLIVASDDLSNETIPKGIRTRKDSGIFELLPIFSKIHTGGQIVLEVGNLSGGTIPYNVNTFNHFPMEVGDEDVVTIFGPEVHVYAPLGTRASRLGDTKQPNRLPRLLC